MSCRTVKVKVGSEEKFSAAAKGRDAAVDETLEFIVGRKEIDAHQDLSVDIEVWDYRLINHFKVTFSVSSERYLGPVKAYTLHYQKLLYAVTMCMCLPHTLGPHVNVLNWFNPSV